MRGKQSGVTSDAMSGPYGTATGAITLEDTTETTRVTQEIPSTRGRYTGEAYPTRPLPPCMPPCCDTTHVTHEKKQTQWESL